MDMILDPANDYRFATVLIHDPAQVTMNLGLQRGVAQERLTVFR